MPAPREIVIVVYDGVQSLDLTGPHEVFSGAQSAIEARGGGDRGYRVTVASLDGAPVRSSSGLGIVPDAALADAPKRIDTLIVAGGAGSRAGGRDPELLGWVRERAGAARRVASVCTGAYVLAAAGLLDGRRATTHWAWCERLAARHPAVDVDPEPIWVRDGRIYTSAGVTAGMDLALALVEEDVGRDIALDVARYLVLFLRRPAGQAQFSAQLQGQVAERDAVRELQHFVTEHPGADLSVPALAERAHMSPRHFARTFLQQVGVTPARYVENVRLEAARRRLEESRDPVELVASACGFGSTESMRRAFLRGLGVAPSEYRRRFGVPIPA
jgi:transcriptional regulator GlxA family with amidase domain